MERVTVLARRELERVLAECEESGDINQLEELWRMGMEPMTEDLIDIIDDGKELPRVVRYDLKQALGGAAAILSGPAAGFLGALAILAGVFALDGARKPLRPGLAVLVATLAAAPGREMYRDDLYSDYSARIARFAGSLRISDFDGDTAALIDKEIILEIGPKLRLNETCHLNMTVW